MVGSWFAGHPRVPGDLHETGTAAPTRSTSAWPPPARWRPHPRTAFDRARKALYEEGISSSRMYLDPDRPGSRTSSTRSRRACGPPATYAGARALGELHERAVVGIQSAAGSEGRPLPLGPVTDPAAPRRPITP